MLKMRFNRVSVTFAAILVAVAFQPQPLQAQFDPGRAYNQSGEVRQRYPDPQVHYDTPGFAPGRQDFTSHEEMLAYVDALQRRTSVVQVRMIGASQEGRTIPALVLSGSDAKIPAELHRLGRPVVVMAGLAWQRACWW